MLKNQRVLGIVENQWDQKPINQNNSDSVGVRSPFVANRRILHSQHFATQRTRRSHIPWGSYWKSQFWRIFCLFSSLQNEPWVPWIFENLAAWESLSTFSEILVCSKRWTCLMSFHVYIYILYIYNNNNTFFLYNYIYSIVRGWFPVIYSLDNLCRLATSTAGVAHDDHSLIQRAIDLHQHDHF